VKDEFWDEAFGGKDVLRLMADARDFRVRKNRFSISYSFTLPAGRVLIRGDYRLSITPELVVYRYYVSFKYRGERKRLGYYTYDLNRVRAELEGLTRLSLSFG
jgi:hypothetical protein